MPLLPRLFLVVLSIVSAALVGAEPTRPNIIFIMSDDHSAGAISAYGSKVNATPNIDRLAREGMLLENCFATNSICSPSRAAILTGKYAHRNGVITFNTFDGEQWTVAKALQNAGYYTGIFGKWHLGSDPTGFTEWKVLEGQGEYINPTFLSPAGKESIKGYATDIIGDLALDFLRQRPKDQPFFLMCHHKAPHQPYEPTAKHWAEYKDRDFPEPDNFNDNYSGRSYAASHSTNRIARDIGQREFGVAPPKDLSPEELNHWKYRQFMRRYLATVASVDDNVGRVLDYLDTNGLTENTIVIYTSDQGFFMGDHGYFDKRFMYEESIRMPFLVRYPPTIKAGSKSDKMVLNIDFAPTFLEFAGVSAPSEIQGRSFMSILADKAPDHWRKSWYYRYYHYPVGHHVQPQMGVRTETHKLMYFNWLDEWELYDLTKDPHEMHNLYDQPKYASLQRELKAELAKLKEEAGDDDRYEVIQQKEPVIGGPPEVKKH